MVSNPLLHVTATRNTAAIKLAKKFNWQFRMRRIFRGSGQGRHMTFPGPDNNVCWSCKGQRYLWQFCTCGLFQPNYQNCQFWTIIPSDQELWGSCTVLLEWRIEEWTTRIGRTPPQIDRSHGSYFMIKGCAAKKSQFETGICYVHHKSRAFIPHISISMSDYGGWDPRNPTTSKFCSSEFQNLG